MSPILPAGSSIAEAVQSPEIKKKKQMCNIQKGFLTAEHSEGFQMLYHFDSEERFQLSVVRFHFLHITIHSGPKLSHRDTQILTIFNLHLLFQITFYSMRPNTSPCLSIGTTSPPLLSSPLSVLFLLPPTGSNLRNVQGDQLSFVTPVLN